MSTNEVHQITKDGSPNIFNGKSDWIYEEEVNAQDRMIWWSPDSSQFIFAKINDTNVREVELDYYAKANSEVTNQYQVPNEPEMGGVNQYPIKTSLKYPNQAHQILLSRCTITT